MKLKKILHSLTSFVTIFALTSGIIITYAPAGAEDLTVDDIKDRIEQIKQDNAQRRDEIDRIEGDITDKQENLDKAAGLLNEQKELVDYYYNLVYYKNQDISTLQGTSTEGGSRNTVVAPGNIRRILAAPCTSMTSTTTLPASSRFSTSDFRVP